MERKVSEPSTHIFRLYIDAVDSVFMSARRKDESWVIDEAMFRIADRCGISAHVHGVAKGHLVTASAQMGYSLYRWTANERTISSHNGTL